MTENSQIIQLIFTAVMLLMLMAIVLIGFFYFSRRKIIKSQLEKANLEVSYQKELLQATIITQEEERARIAQDLHDAISSKLNVVSLQANLLTESDISSSDANKFGAGILKITNSVLESSRKIAHDLLPPTLQKFGLQAAIEELIEELDETKRFSINSQVKVPNGVLSPDDSLHVFRVIQELFNNAIKHSESTVLTIKCFVQDKILFLHYKDNGKGFAPSDETMKQGMGMSGIDNRVQILKGKLKIASQPQEGVEIKIKIPIGHEN